jgi:hypothetical protein
MPASIAASIVWPSVKLYQQHWLKPVKKETGMNRYVLTISPNNIIVVLQVLDTEGEPPAIPANEPISAWRNVTGDTAAQPGYKLQLGPYGESFLPLTPDELEGVIRGRLQQRFDKVEQFLKFNPLQYKVDLAVATPEEWSQLRAIKQYYLDVCATTEQNTFPEVIWPIAPF